MQVLGNLSFLLLVLLGRCLKRAFLGSLSRDELEELVQNSKYAITETMLALTIFREELNLKLLMLFTCLLFMKIFHWLASMRVESIARSQGMTRGQHARLVALMAILAVVDWGFVIGISITILQTRTASVLLLFGLEYMILSVVLSSTFLKYVLLVLDGHWESRGQHWPAKNTWMFYIELTGDLVRLCLYLIFFGIICTYYGLPLHLIRELGITFYTLRERIIKFMHFRRITKNMNERFPDATEEELNQGDKTCIVCREDMEVGHTKKLPCGHMFHFACLRTWLERSHSCPTCRADIPVTAPPPPPANVRQGGVAAPVGAAGADAAAVPPHALRHDQNDGLQLPPLPPGLPPLPPHLQAHLDALRLAAAQAQQELDMAAAAREAENHHSPTAAAAPAAPYPPSPLNSMFGSSPSPVPLMHSPPQMRPFARFSPPPPTTHTMHTRNAHFHNNMAMPPHAYGGPFMFPPPPPPPPAHLFGPMQPPTPFHAAAPGSPAEALYAAHLAHHSMLLQHHMDFLHSSLAQVKLLVEQQKEATRQFEAQRSAANTHHTQTQATQQQQQQTRDKNEGTASPGADQAPSESVDAIVTSEEDENAIGRSDDSSQLTHRRPHESL